MLLAHLADIHLGYRQYHRQTASGINQRESDVANAFRQAITGIIAARPDVIVIAGDLFHAIRPSNPAIVFCFQQLQRLRSALPNSKILMVAGNHDTPRATETGSILKLFGELGIVVVTDEAARFHFDELDLSVLMVPHQALASDDRPNLAPDQSARRQVMVIHGETQDLYPLERWWTEPNALVEPSELSDPRWNYVALGNYHVMRRAAGNAWYSGALEYVTPNPWGELIEQSKHGIRGKGWLLVDLDTRKVEPHFLTPSRRVIDLKPIEARNLAAADLDRLIAERLAKVPGGIKDQLVRLVVHEIPRHVARELDHAAIRIAKTEALHFHLDLRRPEVTRVESIGVPGARRTLTDVLRGYLANRLLPERVDRDRFVQHGVALLESVTFEPDVSG